MQLPAPEPASPRVYPTRAPRPVDDDAGAMNRAENTLVGPPELGVTVSPEALVELELVAVERVVVAVTVEVERVEVAVEPALEPQPARAAIATTVAASVAVRFISAPR
jgi:hypothetical protein